MRCGGLVVSVAEQPLFWAAPAPEVRGPGADSGFGSDQIGSAPALTKLGRLRLQAKKGASRPLQLHTLTVFIFSS